MNFLFLIPILFILTTPVANSLQGYRGLNQQDFAKVRPYLSEKSFGQLVNDISEQKVDELIFSKDLTTIYSEPVVAKEATSKTTEKVEYAETVEAKEKLEDAETVEDINEDATVGGLLYRDLSVTNSHPVLAEALMRSAARRNVDAIILQDAVPSGPYSSGPLSFLGPILDGGFNLLFVPLLLFYAVRGFFVGRNGMGNSMGGLMGFGNQFQVEVTKPNVTLADWSGSPEILRECSEIVSFLQNSSDYDAVGAETPRGILLEGEPGTGKTLIAKAIANEADCSFIALSASEFVEMFVGLGALKVRNLFAEARKNTPCIIFIDEIDAVGRKRGTSSSPGGNDERDQTLNQILFEMDGFKQNEGLIVMAATNRRDVLDPALLRPGRFDRIVNVPLPDLNSRVALFRQYLRNKLVDTKVDIDGLAALTEGFSGADIKNLVNEAAILTARDGRKALLQDDIDKALEKKTIGIAKEVETRSEDSLQRVAIHEAGHAVMAVLFRRYFDLRKVTIQATYSGAGGFTLFGDLEKDGLYTRDMLHKRIVVALGGKAAEEVFYGRHFVSVGASQDLQQANDLARRMVSVYGMGDEARSVEVEGSALSLGPQYSEATRTKIDKESGALVEECYRMAVDLLQGRRDMVERLVKLLRVRGSLMGEEVESFVLSGYNVTEVL